MADIDINDLTQARFMGLMCPASSPQSKLLVNDLVDILIKTEQRQRARKPDDMAAFRNGVSLITGDLLIAMEMKEAHRSDIAVVLPLRPSRCNDGG